jgi:hypothetical protein
VAKHKEDQKSRGTKSKVQLAEIAAGLMPHQPWPSQP